MPGSTWAWYVAHRARPPELLNTAEVRLLGRAQPEGAACRAGHPCAWPLTSGPWAWTHNAGTYVVPPNQTTTRLWITPVVWASDGSQGNWIDSVVFWCAPWLGGPEPLANAAPDTALRRSPL